MMAPAIMFIGQQWMNLMMLYGIVMNLMMLYGKKETTDLHDNVQDNPSIN